MKMAAHAVDETCKTKTRSGAAMVANHYSGQSDWAYKYRIMSVRAHDKRNYSQLSMNNSCILGICAADLEGHS